MLKKSLIIIVLLLLLVFLLKDLLLKVYITNYIEKTFKGDCAIERISISVKRIEVDNLEFSNEGIDFVLEEGGANFSFPHGLKPEVSRIDLSNVYLKIKNLKRMRDALGKTVALNAPEVRPGQTPPLDVDLENITVELRNVKNLSLALNFSFRGSIHNSKISTIENIDISDCNIKFRFLEANNLNLKKIRADLYALKIPCLRIKGEEIRNISIPLEIELGRIVFVEAQNVFLGPDAYFGGSIEFRNPEFICLNLDLQKLSFENPIGIISDDVALRGLFEGRITVCLEGGKVSKIEADFHNDGGGFMNIEKEVSLDFLKAYLDKSSYKALIDGFKDYAYNSGVIKLSKKERDLLLNLKFSSMRMGKRNIIINFHDIWGGGE